MTDQELLELAASAAEIEITFMPLSGCVTSEGDNWNPLENDGDAFRLLFNIGADVYHGTNEYDEPIITIQPESMSLHDAPCALRDSPSEIRRAIVRAAAAIAEDA